MRFKNCAKLTFLFILSMLVVSQVSAFGVTSPYWDERPLEVYPGQVKEFDILLQNMVGDKDIRLMAELVDDQSIASFVDSDLKYTVPVGKKDEKVSMQIVIPAETQIGATYSIIVSFKEISEDEGQMVQMSSAIEKLIPVVVKPEQEIGPEPVIQQEPEEEPNYLLVGIVVGVLLILVIIAIGMMKRDK